MVKSSFFKTFTPTLHFVGFYIFFGSSFSYFLRSIFFLESTDKTGFFNNLKILYNLKLLFYAWMLGTLVASYSRMITKLVDIFSTQSIEFPVVKGLTITKALEMKKFQITQHLAAQDLFSLSDSAKSKRRKEFYALSVPGKRNLKTFFVVVV